ncbi:short chain dehydrogenase [Leptodontidium sp. MPI-SDFR-AT-0119]|nr:short chain dehydrogenase [Leptodontidium sp. MPI-SDFR-AT-0119]
MASKTIILVTGIGFDTTYALANANPNNHVILGTRSIEKGNKALADLKARQPVGTISVLELDITKDDSIRAAVAKISAEFGVLDVLINNAGVIPQDVTDRRTAYITTLHINSISPLLLTEALVPLLQKSKEPRIVNVSSCLGSVSERPKPEFEYYGVTEEGYRMSKAALNMATVCMSVNYKSWGAKVSAFCPGYVVTDLTGEDDRQNRINRGAESSETSAAGILEIVEGMRDGEPDLLWARYGKTWSW